MTLGEFITSYCADHDLSIRQFSSSAGFSHTYISMLINGRPGTRKRPSPTLDTYSKIASACGISLDELLSNVQDDYVTINEIEKQPRQFPELSEDELLLIRLFRSVPEEDRALVLQMIRAALSSKGLL